jgi:hypothetical protein
VVDNLDGTYSTVFVSTDKAEHDLFIRFGTACETDGNALDTFDDNYAKMLAGEPCWIARFNDVLDTQYQPTASPTVNGFIPVTLSPTPAPPDDSALLLGLGIGGGSLIGLCCMSVCIGGFYRRRWNKDKAYIAKGKRCVYASLSHVTRTPARLLHMCVQSLPY